MSLNWASTVDPKLANSAKKRNDFIQKKTELAKKGEVRGESGEPVSGREDLSGVLSLSSLG